MTDDDPTRGSAEYVFRVEFRLDPPTRGVSVDPDRFETVLYREADPPGEDGWLFFRDHLWRGAVGEPAHVRELAAEMLGTTVVSVSFSELRTDEAYLERLKTEIAGNLEAFRSESVDEALSKYLGSSIRVVPRTEES